ncbi:F5/8 type C domain containing protein [Trichomonas vaginalis G3]|uniref:F5/8 type C domain containing protein n=1 Tax=Trichomonas vaginalis (strain ATCC PRA-98 / G3) TaxID=412133 RepID=A2FU24_TRIV3|nr:F5/8 type C domain-containing protein [Trichomonas vaginalis G3]EAX91595.1 F5/8 type C domain containing protein [Trichomonas vaginalis G3]KAI5516574.1 F5/8 type C domain-containing protein [Trichomonas vaginalis G3]|eukprot:XP_001304525.1 F5/8 type C domain containing protein [Trichomonas vaginalis G3]
MFFLFFERIHSQEEVFLENQYFKETWIIDDNKHMNIKNFVNKRTSPQLTVTPDQGSQDFVISIRYVEGTILSSDLTVKDKVKENYKLTVTYEPFTFNGATYNIIEINEMEAQKHYLHKYLKIKCSDENVALNYIDTQHIIINKDVDYPKSWGTPWHIRDPDDFFLSMGQPLYINTFFTGSQFPCAHTKIENTTYLGRVRYYSGKKFADLKKDSEGYYNTWKTVLGAAREDRFEVVRADLFSYIFDISRNTPFRKQFNSWYDWMLAITEDNIMESFKEIEKGNTQNGIGPLDSYVIDDGWNNYNTEKYQVYDPSVSGTTYNTEGFWTFNNKFPHKFSPPSDYSRKIGSNFGVWLGPRGGYVTAGQFGKMIEDAGKGFYNKRTDDIDVASHKYIKNLKDLLIGFIRDYKVNYYKLDGFTDYECTNTSHDHMTGGDDSMYFFTDLWENYIDAYKEMIKAAEDEGLTNFWISTTTYASSSPWHLQWSSSLWMQISGDSDYWIVGNNTNYADQALTYRDSMYYQYFNDYKFQFPTRNMYNHDPVFGQAGTHLKGNLNDEDFRVFLSGCMMRGTAFNELYYTYSMLDEGDKWLVSGDILSWAEKNHHVLQHSQYFGGKPYDGECYGYSAWDGADGFVSLRNPGGSVTKYTITLDRAMGVPESVKDAVRSTRLAHKTTATEEIKNGVKFNYGETLTVTLNPGEMRIYEFHQAADSEAPKIEVVRSLNETTVNLRFNKYIDVSNAQFSIDNLNIKSYKVRGDLKTITFTTDAMKNYTEYTIHVKNVCNSFGVALNTDVKFTYFAQNIMGTLSGSFKGNNQNVNNKQVDLDSFTVRIHVNDFKNVANAKLFHSADNTIKAEIVNNYVQFTVGSTTVVSSDKISPSIQDIYFVRERNAMIKIYMNSDISASAWDKTMPSCVTICNIIIDASEIVYKFINIYNYGLAYSELSVAISIGNDKIERQFEINNGKLHTSKIVNSITGMSFVPAEGSNNFVITTPGYVLGKVLPIDRSDWKIKANSEESITPRDEGAAVNLIDGDITTIWHSKYDDKGFHGHDDRKNNTDPYVITIDMGKVQKVGALSYTPRQSGWNGAIKKYELYTANTEEELNDKIAARQNPDASGEFKYYAHYPCYANLTKVIECRWVAFLSILVKPDYGSGAEFNLYPTAVPLPLLEINANDFKYASHEIITENNHQKLIFHYKPYNFNGALLNVTVIYDLENDKPYMEKEVLISLPQGSDFTFDHIDLESFVLTDEQVQQSWTHPNKEKDTRSWLPQYLITLGQPVYICDLYTGCRFPLTDNRIEENIAYFRYNTGKKFAQLEKDENGTYHCWKTVIGAARSNSLQVIRNDFFSYIEDISVKTTFRKQYNSWYDWMMSINESNILDSFKEIEKGMTQLGVPPLNSYVVDDGWNNYNSKKYDVYDEDASGTTYNEDGFWTFNSKFTQGFKLPSDFAHRIASGFGMWLGPRGGYSYPDTIAKMIQDAGKGYYNENAGDIDVGSGVYVENLKKFLVNMTNLYKINYFKLDGFAFTDNKNPQHDHVTGGPNGAFYYTDMWEKYEKLFDALRESAKVNEIIDMWISITCYVNSSPFHLQWANSVYIQVSNDHDFINIGGNDNMADQMLTFRDACYYNFSDYFAFQFPTKAIYNHDPIYGKTGTGLENTMDDEYFRLFLLMCGMRGNAFYEMYYSYTMLDEGEKWYVNAEALKYIEGRYNILQHAQRFGGDPRLGYVYGYSSWNDVEGTIAIRNPNGTVQSYKLKLDREIGVPENIKSVFTKTILAHRTTEAMVENKEYKYGDEIEFTLQPGEARIIDLNAAKDDKAPEVEIVKYISQNKTMIRFNEKIIFNKDNFKLKSRDIVNVSIKADFRTVIIEVEPPFGNNTDYEFIFDGVSDIAGNKLNGQYTQMYRACNKLVNISNAVEGDDNKIMNDEFTLDSFSIKLNINTLGNYNGLLLEDKDNKIIVETESNKFIKFVVGNLSVVSSHEITDNTNVTLVRERNTMLKIYVNGTISNSSFRSGEKDVVKMKKIKLAKNSVKYNSIVVVNTALNYKETNIDLPNDYEKQNDEDNNRRMKIIIGAAVGGGVLILLIIIIGVVIGVNKSRKAKLDSMPLITQN